MCEIWKVQWQDTPTVNLIRKNRGLTAIREIYMPRKFPCIRYLNQALAWASMYLVSLVWTSVCVCVCLCVRPQAIKTIHMK